MSNSRNGSAIQAMCTDIDGTLLDSRRELSDQTISAIGSISKTMPVILASSRMPSAMRHLQRVLGITDHPLICYNGGYVMKYDASEKPSVLYSARIPLEICSAILALTSGSRIHISFYSEDLWYAPQIDEWTLREATITKVSPIVRPGKDVLDTWANSNLGAHKVMCMGEASEIKVLEAALRSTFMNEVHVYHSKSTYLEIAPKIISKGSALRLLLEKYYNIPLVNVIAFGDNYNDIELLQSVGLGIAVANARDEVKAVAKEITADSKQDGVAHAIHKYVLGTR